MTQPKLRSDLPEVDEQLALSTSTPGQQWNTVSPRVQAGGSLLVSRYRFERTGSHVNSVREDRASETEHTATMEAGNR